MLCINELVSREQQRAFQLTFVAHPPLVLQACRQLSLRKEMVGIASTSAMWP